MFFEGQVKLWVIAPFLVFGKLQITTFGSTPAFAKSSTVPDEIVFFFSKDFYPLSLENGNIAYSGRLPISQELMKFLFFAGTLTQVLADLLQAVK